MFVEIATSEEANAHRASQEMIADLSDGEFLMTAGRLVYGEG